MNLLDPHERWLPVRQHDGTQRWVSVVELSDPALAAFDAPRADFNGALMQFAIGIYQTSTPAASPGEWARWFQQPPSAETLQAWSAPFQPAFTFDGEGARFLQDFTLRAADVEPQGIGSLLIESPGDNAIKRNTDHFVKRGQVSAVCPACAAAAVISSQLNAPAGGAGFRTGLRGGGPLTTILVTQTQTGQPRSLWHNIWLNVRDRPSFLDGGGDRHKTEPHFSFPWLVDQAVLQPPGGSGEVGPVQVHPAHVFWSMPQRLRLDMDHPQAGECDLCGRASDRLIRQVAVRNLGLNYKGPWNHPLSPYYASGSDWLPVHPQPGGLAYRHWLAWLLGQPSDKAPRRPAAIVEHTLRAIGNRLPDQVRLWAFGFDMDNAKARCWYEVTVPLYGLQDCTADALESLRYEVSEWLAGAELVASSLRSAVRDAWFKRDAKGDFSHVDAAFWSQTERQFYVQLRQRIACARTGQDNDRLATAQAWATTLRNAALTLFDDVFVGTGAPEHENPGRVARARRTLDLALQGERLKKALGLPAAPKRKAGKASPETT